MTVSHAVTRLIGKSFSITLTSATLIRWSPPPSLHSAIYPFRTPGRSHSQSIVSIPASSKQARQWAEQHIEEDDAG